MALAAANPSGSSHPKSTPTYRYPIATAVSTARNSVRLWAPNLAATKEKRETGLLSVRAAVPCVFSPTIAAIGSSSASRAPNCTTFSLYSPTALQISPAGPHQAQDHVSQSRPGDAIGDPRQAGIEGGRLDGEMGVGCLQPDCDHR